MEKLKVGIAGIGNMGSSHARKIFEGKIPDMELCAVADKKEERRSWAKECFGNISVYCDALDMLKHADIDAAIIAVPHYDHPRLVMSALENGLHVMCEKPAGVYTKQVREMNEFAAKQDKTFAMMFNQRTNCVYRKMKEMVEKGDIGEIKRVNWIITDWYRTQFYYDSGEWRATWAGEGGGFDKRMIKKFLTTPAVIGVLVSFVLVFTGIRLPSLVMSYCKYMNNLVTPLALLLTGYIIYEIGLKNLKLDRDLAIMLLFRFLLVPGVSFALCELFGVAGLGRSVLLVETAMPVVTQTVVAAADYGADEQFAAQGAALSTLACFVVIPVLMLIL